MRVLLVTDSHLAPGSEAAVKNWTAVRDFAERSGAALTIHLGDITRDGWSDSTEHEYAALAMADWPTPIRFLPGNHDVGDNPPAPNEPCKQPLSPELLARHRALFGDDYWALDIGSEEDWRLIGINAQLLGSDTLHEEEQWAWLERAIAEAANRPIAFFSHKPLYQDDPEDEPPHIRYVPTAPRKRLRGLLAQADCRIYASGHTHQALDRMLDDTRHIWVPSTAYRFPDDMQEIVGQKLVGIGLLHLDAQAGTGGFRFDLIAPEGIVQHEYVRKTQ